MAQADWAEQSGSLSVGSIDRGVTYGITPPNGGGSFIYGFNSLDTVEGGAALRVDLTNFNPMAKGAQISGAIQRGVGGGNSGFSPFLFVGGQGTSINDYAYLLGLSDEDPYRIVLVKGRLVDGCPVSSDTTVLRSSTPSYSVGQWHHLRLDMIANLTGDVILQVFENDLGSLPVSTPSWAAITGMAEFVDDSLGVNSGSAPYTSGYGGFGFRKNDITRRGYFDHIRLARQT